SRIKLACGPVNFVTRNPGVVAAAVVPLQVLSEGRVICNIAAGDSAVAAAGLKPQKIADMERDLVYLRTWLERGEVEFPERNSRLEWADALTWKPIPIQTVCSGPRSIALAGRRADRICLGVGTNNERVRWALDIIGEELAKAGRNRDDIRIGMLIPLALAQD